MNTNKTFVAVGVTDAAELLAWRLPPKNRAALLKAVSLEEGEPAAVRFLESMEHAIRSALWREDLKSHRAEVKLALLKTAEQGKALLDALDQMPEAGRAYFRHAGMLLATAREKASEVWMVTERAALQANNDLSGRGDDHDSNPAILAADIAQAMQQVGIKPSLTRPKYDKAGNLSEPPFWTVTTICFHLAGFPHKDPYPHMRDGLKHVTIGCED